MLPLDCCEASFCQHISNLISSANVLGVDPRIHLEPLEDPIELNAVGSAHMAHTGASAFDDHFDHCFVVFEESTWKAGNDR